MKKILPILFIFFFLSGLGRAFAQLSDPVGSLKSEIVASVGQYYLSVSGYVSPYASIIMTSDNVFLRATVADANGNFYISQVLIKTGFSSFCLEAIDFKRIGSSTTCFSFSGATGNITMTNLFLPPTLGLANAEIPAGSSAVAFGYTMPGARVTLYLSGGGTLVTSADQSGYYSFTIKNLQVGKYELYTKAEYKSKESLAPTKKVNLRALSFWEQLLLFLKNLLQKVFTLLTSVSLGLLWIGIPILILIIILLIKLWPSQTRLWPEKFNFPHENKLFSLIPFGKQEKLLHHWWWVGY